MKSISNNMVRDVGCGFRRKCAIPSCCITRRASRWVISGPFAFATANFMLSKNRINLTPKQRGAFTGTCGKYPGVLADASWLSPTTPDIITPVCTKRGVENKNPDSNCSSCRPIAQTLIPSSGFGNSFAASASTIVIFRNSNASQKPWKRFSSNGASAAVRSLNCVRSLNIRNYLRRYV